MTDLSFTTNTFNRAGSEVPLAAQGAIEFAKSKQQLALEAINYFSEGQLSQDDMVRLHIPAVVGTPIEGDIWWSGTQGYRYSALHGLTARTNLFANQDPAMTLDGYFWSAGVAEASPDIELEDRPAVRYTCLTTVTPFFAGITRSYSAGTYTVSFSVVSTQAANLRSFNLHFGSEVVPFVLESATTPMRVSITATLDAGVHETYITPAEGEEVLAGDVVYIAAVLVEQSATAGSFFDGYSTGGTWVGTPGASSSQYDPGWMDEDARVKAVVDIVKDADTLDGYVDIYSGPQMPPGPSFGDLWEDDAYNLYRYEGFWIQLIDSGDPAIAEYLNDSAAIIGDALDQLAGLEGKLDGVVRIFYQSTVPDPAEVGLGDVWIDISIGKVMKRWDGDSWELIDDERILKALEEVQGKITSYYTPGEPVAPAEGFSVGDLWFETDQNNKPYRWDGTDWVDVSDPRVDEHEESIGIIRGDIDNVNAAIDNLDGFLGAAFPEGPINVSGALDQTIQGYAIQYSVGSSEVTPPVGGWSEVTPVRTPGTFIWFRTIITYGDGNTTTTSPALLTGNTGSPGSTGIPGPPGADGTSLYTWLKYANSTTPTPSEMFDSPVGMAYIGLAYNKTSPAETTVHTDYAWSLIRGADGEQGIQGPPGADGITTYTWVKYSNSANGIPMQQSPVGMTYIGLAFNKATADESDTPGDYQWSLIQGPQGPQGNQGIPGNPGADGITYYTWLKYASSATPSAGDMSDSPAGKTYMGIAVGKTSATETSDYQDYSWSLIQGPQGNQGIPGAPGADGTTTYTWVKYAPNGAPTSGQMTETPVAGTTHIGLAFNKTTQEETSIPGDYQWSLIQGDPGEDGVSITAVTPYFQQKVAPAPDKPTTDPPPNPWTTTEPNWVQGQMLYRTERVLYSNGSFSYTDVTQVAAYQAADAAMISANGKNIITYTDVIAADAPGSTPTVTTGRILGDIHRNRETVTGVIYAEWRLGGSGWEPIKFGDMILTSLDVGKLTAGSAAIDTGVINKLWTDVVQSRKITTDMLLVGSGENLVPDPYYTSTALNEARDTASAGTWTVATHSGLPCMVNTPLTSATLVLVGSTEAAGRYYPVVAGDTYRIRVRAHLLSGISSTNLYLSPQWVDHAGVLTTEAIKSAQINTTPGWVEFEWVAPSNAVGFLGMLSFSAFTGTSIAIAAPSVVSKTTPSLIVEGGVKAIHVDTDELWADTSWLGQAKAQVLTLSSIRPEMMTANEELSINPAWAKNEVIAVPPYNLPSSGMLFVTTTSYLYKSSPRALSVTSAASETSTLRITDEIPVSPGEKIYLQMHMRSQTGGAGAAILKAVWYNASGAVITNALLEPDWRVVATQTSTAYNSYDRVVQAPDGAVKMIVLLTGSVLGVSSALIGGTSVRRAMSSMSLEGLETELSPQGVTVYELVQAEGDKWDRVVLTSMGRVYSAYDATDQTTSTLSGVGLTAPRVSADEIWLNGNNILDSLSSGAGQILVNDSPNTASQVGTTTLGYREIAMDAIGGQAYLILVMMDVLISAAGSSYAFIYKTQSSTGDAPAPLITSTEAARQVWYATAGGDQVRFWWVFVPSVDEHARFLFAARSGSTRTCQIRFGRFQVIQLGSFKDLPDSGRYSDGGYAGGTAPPVTAPPVQTHKDVVWNASWSQTYNSYGTNPTSWVPTWKMRQGLGGNSRYAALVGQPTAMRTALMGSSISKLEVYLYHAGPSSSGVGHIRAHRYASAPSYATGPSLALYESDLSVPSWGKNSGKWVTIPSAWYSAFESGTSRGIAVGDTGVGYNMMDFHSALAGSYTPKFRATYTK